MFHFLYLDESGSPAMNARGLRNQRWLTLGGFYIPADSWRPMNDALNLVKSTWLGTHVAEPEKVELHTSDFGRRSPWNDLYTAGEWPGFLAALAELVGDLPIVTLSATIDKQSHFGRYVAPIDPYELAYEFVIERFDSALRPGGDCGAVVIDPRSEGTGRLDQRMRTVHAELRLRRDRIVEDPFFPASSLSAGVQVADVVAWAVRKHHAAAAGEGSDSVVYPAVHSRYRRSAGGRVRGYGEKVFP